MAREPEFGHNFDQLVSIGSTVGGFGNRSVSGSGSRYVKGKHTPLRLTPDSCSWACVDFAVSLSVGLSNQPHLGSLVCCVGSEVANR